MWMASPASTVCGTSLGLVAYHFLKEARQEGALVWLAGVRPDLLSAFERLNFSAWIAGDHIFPQGADEDSATLAAVRRIRSELPEQCATAPAKLYYRV